ncbi:MAG: MFS transporter, partial [Pseudomonadales bacterium]|nr:MFS transporter [Pseudomonadales bacterium]
TVSKGSRGVLMGIAGSIAGSMTLLLGLLLNFSRSTDTARDDMILTSLLLVAAGFWMLALLMFRIIAEPAAETSKPGDSSSLQDTWEQLTRNRELQRFVIARTLLLATALAPPFYVMLAQARLSSGAAGLGTLIIASGLASSLSSVVWGKLGDRSSRLVMIIAAVMAGVISLLHYTLHQTQLLWTGSATFHAAMYFLLIISHSGIRMGRKVYLVDMATEENRARYVAISNTVIGIAILLSGSLGLVAETLGVEEMILVLGILSMGAAMYCSTLPEVSKQKLR